MYPVPYANTHYDVTNLVNHGIIKNAKTWISWEPNIKKILYLCLKWHTLRSYRFVAEVTFKNTFIKILTLFVASTEIIVSFLMKPNCTFSVGQRAMQISGMQISKGCLQQEYQKHQFRIDWKKKKLIELKK